MISGEMITEKEPKLTDHKLFWHRTAYTNFRIVV